MAERDAAAARVAAPSLTLWDLLEETYRAQEPELAHTQMLERSGFLTG